MNAEKGLTNCYLCGQLADIRESHIIPDWVYRDELRGDGGKVVSADSGIVRYVPAYTHPLLCSDCEQRFSKWENPAKLFARQAGSAYGDWLFPFATSISWRVLNWFLLNPEELSDEGKSLLRNPEVDESLSCWRDFLLYGRLGEASKRHRQHLFLRSPDYPLRNMACMYVGTDGTHWFTYAQFSYYGILGLIKSSNPKALQKSAIQVAGGELLSVAFMTPNLYQKLQGIEIERLRQAVVCGKELTARQLRKESRQNRKNHPS